MKKAIVIALVFAAGVGIGQVSGNLAITRADPGHMTQAVSPFADAFERASSAAKTPEQVTQLAAETSVPMQLALIKQNDEIIRLLRKLNKEKY